MSRSTSCEAASRAALSIVASAASSAGSMPSRRSTSTPWTAAASGETSNDEAPLCGIARRNKPRAAGAPSSAPTLWPPADSPATVTRAGSPPKAAMLSRTHSRAAIWSSRPKAPAPGRPGT